MMLLVLFSDAKFVTALVNVGEEKVTVPDEHYLRVTRKMPIKVCASPCLIDICAPSFR